MSEKIMSVEEAVWHGPDWDCPRCNSVNGSFRERCRICGFDTALVSEGHYFGDWS